MAKILRLRGGRLYSKLLYLSGICFVSLIILYTFQAVFDVFFPTRRACTQNEPIDVVYTWVNGSDPVFLKDLTAFLKTKNISVDDKYLSQRFIDKNELQFSLRSLEKFAPWINHVYLVTNGQIPHWLNLDCDKLTVVTHEEIFFDQNDLPTFSSPAIESHLHRIPGLSKKFIYFNDDIFIAQPMYKEDFITENEGYKLYFSYSLGTCSPQCYWEYVGDNQCDSACNNFYCQYDGGDCENGFTTPSEEQERRSDKEPELDTSKFKSSGKNLDSRAVIEYNRKVIEDHKLLRKMYKKKQRKLKEMKMISQDQSTQVNFPLSLKKKPRTIRRFPTSEDIYYRNRPPQMSNLTNWQNPKQPTLPRPKSLNFTPEPSKSPVKLYSIHDSPISRSSACNEGSYSPFSPSKERSTVYSCSSSLASNPKNGLRSSSTQKLIHLQIDEESSACSCKCSCKGSFEMTGPQMIHFNERQSLSWRRLHMSRAKLKATSATSELLSGFAMVAMVELQINEPTGVPEWLFVIFAVCTTILVSVHIFALMISTYILPNIDAIAKMEICEWVSESPHERMRGFIEIAWAFSTVLGLFLFLLEVAILCWVKFWDYSFPAAIAATVIVIPVLIIFVLFAVHFYHSLVVIKCNSSFNDMVQLEDMKKHLDNMSNPV